MGVAAAGEVVSSTHVTRADTGGICKYRDLTVARIDGGCSDLLPKTAQALAGRPAEVATTVGLPTEKARGAHGPHGPGLTFTDTLENNPSEPRGVGAEPGAEDENGEIRHSGGTRSEHGQRTGDADHLFAGRSLAVGAWTVETREAGPGELASGEARPDRGVLA